MHHVSAWDIIGLFRNVSIIPEFLLRLHPDRNTDTADGFGKDFGDRQKSGADRFRSCLDKPTEGKFFLDGQDILNCSENDMSDIRLNKIGFVFQSFHLLPRQSALANVELPLNYAKVPKKERRERAMKALERVGLADRVDFQPNQLSGGQMQRVAIARAIVNNPKLLLADEPTGALDSKSGAQVMELFQKLNDEGVTVLMITHDPDIAAHAKRVVMIRDGELKEKEVK